MRADFQCLKTNQLFEPHQRSRDNTRSRSVNIADGEGMLSTCQEPTRNCLSRKDWLINIMNNVDETATDQCEARPRIQRVWHRLKEVPAYKKCFDPVVVSIGPYHHGKPEFQAMERLKASCARQFVSGCDLNIHIYYNNVLKVADKARECYAEGSIDDKLDNEAFARIMFLDGCFVLNFIYSITHDKKNKLTTNSYNAAFLSRDMLLLENQLPYLVLQALMDLRFPEDGGKGMINQFINYQICPADSTNPLLIAVGGQQPLHLLDLLRTKLLGSSAPSSSKSIHSNWYSFRSVKELRSVGINFQRSHTYCLKDIQFQSRMIYGELSLPPIVIDDSTMPKFLNLMAYELCPDASHDYSVTSYICFLDSLIDSADDVKELRSKNILPNFLGSDDQVADLFNQLTIEMVPDLHAYYEVKEKIETHYKNRVKVSIVEFLTTHFRSPWTAFAFFAATFVILLTLVQAIFRVFPR